MRRTFFSIGLLVAIASLPVNADEEEFKGPELFPVTSFWTWTYRVQGQDDKLHVSVFDSKEKMGERIFRFEGRIRNQPVASELLSIRKDGVYRLRHDNHELEPPLLICRFPPLKGETWKAEYKIGDKKTTVVYDCDTEEITYQNKKMTALVIRAEIADPNGAIKNTCWYAPRIGLVKQVIQEGDNKIVIELEEHGRPPPKSKQPNP